MSDSPPQLSPLPDPLPDRLTRAELALLCGRSAETVRRWTRNGMLPVQMYEPLAVITGDSSRGGMALTWRGAAVAEAIKAARSLALRDWYDCHPYGTGHTGAAAKADAESTTTGPDPA